MQITNLDVLKDDYEQQGFVVVNELFEKGEVAEFQRVTNELVEQSKSHQKSDTKFDLEQDHSAVSPRVQRIKVPHKQSEVFGRAVRNPKLLRMLKILLGENVRFRNSKLNIKAAHGGSAVDWHQDWAFYPHTNPDLLAVGIMIDDIDEDNAPLMVVPQSHLGETLNHHHKGIFSGSVDLKNEDIDISTAVKITGKAGSASFHHVKTLHGSSPNFSNLPRRLLLFEFAAADAWPLVDFEVYGDFSEYEEKIVIGKNTLQPRCENVDMIMPYPRPPNPDSIYRIQESRKK
ncbi:MAG: phytanoyl-CoA dioxygenase family protein [SAR324 cluster bacterium]|nr:phytanoyl-CoA dioxygenase family protein [SAR324 cluster bacterium]